MALVPLEENFRIESLVVATLQADAKTPSGFKWSSSLGPPIQIYSGTLSKGTVVVDDKRPISYVLPIVKKSLGAG